MSVRYAVGERFIAVGTEAHERVGKPSELHRLAHMIFAFLVSDQECRASALYLIVAYLTKRLFVGVHTPSSARWRRDFSGQRSIWWSRVLRALLLPRVASER